jgi:hypothetical protein
MPQALGARHVAPCSSGVALGHFVQLAVVRQVCASVFVLFKLIPLIKCSAWCSGVTLRSPHDGMTNGAGALHSH